MTENKKGLGRLQRPAPNYFAKIKANSIRLAAFLIAAPETAIMAAVFGFIIGLALAGLWGG